MAKTPPRLQAKLDEIMFRVPTTLQPPQIVEAANRAAEVGKQAMSSKTKAGDVYDDGCRFHVKAAWNRLADLLVLWQATGDGRHEVELLVENWTLSQPTVAGFIPAGPKSLQGLKSMQRFSEALLIELQSATPATAPPATPAGDATPAAVGPGIAPTVAPAAATQFAHPSLEAGPGATPQPTTDPVAVAAAGAWNPSERLQVSLDDDADDSTDLDAAPTVPRSVALPKAGTPPMSADPFQATAPPDAGWYDDPTAPGRLRWWDGTSWTEHTSI